MAAKASFKKPPQTPDPPVKRIDRETPESLGALSTNHPIPMWIYDRESSAFLHVNAAAVKQYGYSRAEFKKMTIDDLLPKEDVARQAAGIADEAHSGSRIRPTAPCAQGRPCN